MPLSFCGKIHGVKANLSRGKLKRKKSSDENLMKLFFSKKQLITPTITFGGENI